LRRLTTKTAEASIASATKPAILEMVFDQHGGVPKVPYLA
jgi:hypothetical protein